MWNMVVGSLLTGATAVLYDGSPTLLDTFWHFVAKSKMTYFGTSAPYIHFLMKQGYKPTEPLPELRAVGSTGAPLTPDGFQWVYEQLGSHIWLNSLSGGTDVCTAFVGGCIWLPVYSGEIQCRCLGAPVEVVNDEGTPVRNEVGELVLTGPMPSMPVFFWNDPHHERYRSSYFEMFPGIWRHGDWACITDRNTVIIYGRSDATLKKQGVRMGTSEFYAVMDRIPEIQDALVVSLELPDGSFYMPLFVKLNEGYQLTPELVEKIQRTIREELSPKHLPDAIVEAPGIPYTLNGKKMETPVKRLLLNFPLEKAVNLGSMQNPEVMDFYIRFRDEKVLPLLKRNEVS
jgi:acetoacetyl-CoA synthetase